ncbi:MAG: hypothetical protein AABM42_11045 [Actinomycetota bacterium]
MANWFKLVGSTEDPVPEDWEDDGPEMFTEVRFPWNKPPRDIWAPGRLILYAVGWRVLVATQTVNGPPEIKQRHEPLESAIKQAGREYRPGTGNTASNAG